MIRVVLDSNVYISALLFGGNPRTVVELAQRGEFHFFISTAIRLEIEVTLKGKFRWLEPRVREVAAATWGAAKQVAPQVHVADCPDPDDNRVLECALACEADYIVTGDRHLLNLHPFRGISILNSRQFLKQRTISGQNDT